MRALHAMERRLQELTRKFENKERLGKIVDVKFENNRWFVKMNDGEDQSPSGGSAGGGGGGGGHTFKSDWQPWKSSSHGTIKRSNPPKKGQHVLMRSVGGQPELSTVESHHYGPDNPSPHGKEDEIVQLIEDEDEEGGKEGGSESGAGGESGEGGEDKWNAWTRETKDTHHLIIRKKEKSEGGGEKASEGSEGGGGGGMDAMNSKGGQKKQKERKIPEVDEDEGDEKTTQIKTTKDFILKTVGKFKSYFRQDKDKIHARFGEKDEKGDMLFDEDQVKVQFKDKKAMVKWTENDLTQQMGEDDKSKVVFTEDNIILTQGGDDASKTVWSKDAITITQGDGTRIVVTKDFVEVKGASDASMGVDGAWVHCVDGKVHLGVADPKAKATVRVMTEAGPSNKVFAVV